MEAIKSACPTDVLVDISDVISCINTEATSSLTHPKNIPDSYNGVSSDKNYVDQSILHVSSRIVTELDDFKLNKLLKADTVKEPNIKEINNDCPTAILIDVPCNQSFHLNDIDECDQSDYEVERKKESEKDFSKENSSNFLQSPSEEKNQILSNRLRWKTPSPKSMSRISKEASKIIQHLNSSDIFNEDELLSEEILPISINFDDIDDDVISEKTFSNHNNLSDNANSLSVNAQIQDDLNDKVILKEELNSCDSKSISSNGISFRHSNRSIQSQSKTHFDVSKNNSEDDEFRKKVCLSTGSNCVDDVFITTHVSAEDKENIHRKGNKVIMPKNKTSGKVSYETPYKKSNYNGTLKNVSNTKCDAYFFAKYNHSSDAKKENTPLKKNDICMKAKTVQPVPLRSKIKRMVLSDSSDQKLNTVIKDSRLTANPVCNSSSSAVKQQNVCSKIKTPLRRYSICTPLKCASSLNSVTPSSDFRKHEISRFTPQSARASLSFSRSCQQFSKSSTSSVKHQNSYSTVPLGNVKESLGRISSKGKIPSFSHSTSSISFQSLKRNSMYSSSKDKFCNKLCLPSPLPVEPEKKVARALFPTAPKWKN